MTDSILYRHLWSTDETRAIFDEPARLHSWLAILVALADAQAELGDLERTLLDADEELIESAARH